MCVLQIYNQLCHCSIFGRVIENGYGILAIVYSDQCSTLYTYFYLLVYTKHAVVYVLYVCHVTE